jgi:uncharacterized protein YjiS (DUF1127 family)
MNPTLERLAQPFTGNSAGTPGAVALLDRLLAYIEIAAERRRLASLDDHTLRDIGISRADAMAESGRSFWDIPPGR